LLRKVDQQTIGLAGFHPFDEYLPGAIEFGFIIERSFRGKGYGRAVGTLQIHYAAKYLDTKYLYAAVHPQNQPSRILLEKLGLQYLEDRKLNRGLRTIYRTTLAF
jgi:ribosomal-protein-alanine N-acetyltransferase